MSSNLGLLGLETFGSDFDIRCGLVGIGYRSNREVGTGGLKPRNRILNYDDCQRVYRTRAASTSYTLQATRCASQALLIESRRSREWGWGLREGKNSEGDSFLLVG